MHFKPLLPTASVIPPTTTKRFNRADITANSSFYISHLTPIKNFVFISLLAPSLPVFALFTPRISHYLSLSTRKSTLSQFPSSVSTTGVKVIFSKTLISSPDGGDRLKRESQFP